MDSNSYVVANWQYCHGSIPKGYQFWGNLILEGGEVHLLLRGGTRASYPFDRWITEMSIGAGRLFGPAVPIAGFSKELLEELHAVALYSKD